MKRGEDPFWREPAGHQKGSGLGDMHIAVKYRMRGCKKTVWIVFRWKNWDKQEYYRLILWGLAVFLHKLSHGTSQVEERLPCISYRCGDDGSHRWTSWYYLTGFSMDSEASIMDVCSDNHAWGLATSSKNFIMTWANRWPVYSGFMPKMGEAVKGEGDWYGVYGRGNLKSIAGTLRAFYCLVPAVCPYILR